jgi:hypothetical protein
MKDALERVLPRIGGSETLDRLAGLSGSDFTSVMLEVARRRAARESPASVLRRYERDRFVQPGQGSPGSARAIRRVENVLLGCIPEDVWVVTLAPLVPLGAHSALGPVSQDKVVSTIRACEVAADPTNALALEAASRRARARTTAERLVPIRLAAVQRVVRAQQPPDAPGFFAHFGLFGLVTAGRDTGSLQFEQSALTGQLRIAIRGVGFAARAEAADVQIALTPLSDRGERIAAAVTADLGPVTPAEVVIDRERSSGRGYYRDLCFKVNVHSDGRPHEVGDGGFTDWTARLIANAKERLLICGLSTDRLAAPPVGRARS